MVYEKIALVDPSILIFFQNLFPFLDPSAINL